MCLPLPLRNNTTPDNSTQSNIDITTTSSYSAKNLSIINNTTFITTTEQPRLGTISNVSFNSQQAKDLASNRWIALYGIEAIYLPARISQEIPEQFRLIKKIQRANVQKRRSHRLHGLLISSVVDIVMLMTILLIMITVSLYVLSIRQQYSLDFVRNATILYHRQVDNDTRIAMSETKVLLSSLALKKGIYKRGMLKQLTNVFSLLGSMAPSRAPEICFSEDFTAIKSTEELSYTRIKLLTPEEVARDEF